jgi:hypothetical protein
MAFQLTTEDHLPGDRNVFHFNGGYEGTVIITQAKGNDQLEEVHVPLWALKEFVGEALRAKLTETLDTMDPEDLLERVVLTHQKVWLQGFRSCRERGNSHAESVKAADALLKDFKERFGKGA